MLLDASAAAQAQKSADLGPRGGGDAAGRDPPPSRRLRRTYLETAEHRNAGLRVQLAAVLQRHRHFRKLSDPAQLLV